MSVLLEGVQSFENAIDDFLHVSRLARDGPL